MADASRGCAGDIEINVERPSQCWSDGQKTLCYPTLCLAHELVHAWRGLTGRMMLVGSQDESNDIEEVITTGLPPYNYEGTRRTSSGRSGPTRWSCGPRY